jgi:hypothetical protein
MLSVIKESLAYNKIPSYLREQKLFFTPPTYSYDFRILKEVDRI